MLQHMYCILNIYIYIFFWGGPNPSGLVFLEKYIQKNETHCDVLFFDAIRKWPEWFCELKEETYLYFQCFVTKSRLNRFFWINKRTSPQQGLLCRVTNHQYLFIFIRSILCITGVYRLL